MESVQFLNMRKAETERPKAPNKGLMYVEAQINEKTTKATIDTSATHNFVSKDEANRLGLQIVKETGWVKAVNSEAQPIHGTPHGVNICQGPWSGKVDLYVVPMDDYQVVLGMDFLSRVKVALMPFVKSMCIMEEGTPCMVPLVQGAKINCKTLSPHRRAVDRETRLDLRANESALGHVKVAPSKARKTLEKETKGSQGQTNPVHIKVVRRRWLTGRYTDGDHGVRVWLSKDRQLEGQVGSKHKRYGASKTRTHHERIAMRALQNYVRESVMPQIFCYALC
ncbi:hypothetical protein AMTR_s00136p00064270 [Amborella trichopoda]|uniref:Aspartic peptidase DDI1-type domain-containing protein n=1 Tax=Amborella trichopoda TaxID=13333 RepID=W1NFN4_AMBTC|nr:hypothetical protein AMTR_s00136p00064270 [Amborella trichopoda]